MSQGEYHPPYEMLDEKQETTHDGHGYESSRDFKRTPEDDMEDYTSAFEVGMHTNPSFHPS